jgi:WD40 repeat protein
VGAWESARIGGRAWAAPEQGIGLVARATGAAAALGAEGEGEDEQLPIDINDFMAYGPPGCPVVLVGRQVWNPARKTIQAELEGEGRFHDPSTISPDGHWIATTGVSSDKEKNPITVWDATTGVAKLSIPGQKDRRYRKIVIANERVYLSGDPQGEVWVWSIETGQEEKQLSFPSDDSGERKWSMTLDGKYIALASRKRVVIISADSGSVVATLPWPRSKPPAGEANPNDPNHPGQPPGGGASPITKPTVTRPIETQYGRAELISFSPDGMELAVYFESPRPTVVCWNHTGRVVFEQPFSLRSRGWSSEGELRWFPDRSAWLNGNHIIDRQTNRTVYSFPGSRFEGRIPHLLDDNHLVGTHPGHPNQLRMVPVPWKEIRQSLALLHVKGAALLSPAEPVGLKIELVSLRGHAETTTNSIREAFIKRLARDELSVADNRPTYFHIKFSEKEGELLPIVEYERFLGPRTGGRDTGKKIAEALGRLDIELIVPGRDKPIWRQSIDRISSRTFNTEITEEVIRSSMLDNLLRSISGVVLPYFIPSDERNVWLPVTPDRM